jgi:hypothetical protein
MPLTFTIPEERQAEYDSLMAEAMTRLKGDKEKIRPGLKRWLEYWDIPYTEEAEPAPDWKAQLFKGEGAEQGRPLAMIGATAGQTLRDIPRLPAAISIAALRGLAQTGQRIGTGAAAAIESGADRRVVETTPRQGLPGMPVAPRRPAGGDDIRPLGAAQETGLERIQRTAPEAALQTRPSTAEERGRRERWDQAGGGRDGRGDGHDGDHGPFGIGRADGTGRHGRAVRVFILR